MSVTVTFTPDQGGINRLLHDQAGPYGQWLTRLGLRCQNAARIKANVDTGLMRSRIEFRVETTADGLVGILAAKTSYAIFVHERHNPFLTDAVRENL